MEIVRIAEMFFSGSCLSLLKMPMQLERTYVVKNPPTPTRLSPPPTTDDHMPSVLDLWREKQNTRLREEVCTTIPPVW